MQFEVYLKAVNIFKVKIDALCGFILGIVFFCCLRPYLVITNELVKKFYKKAK